MPAQQRGRFGTVRKLASGRYQVRCYGPDGKRHSAPRTFERKSDATKYLALVEAKITREEWADPDRGRVLLGEYADKWISERAGLRPSTVQLYRRLLNKYVRPELGEYPLNRLTTAGLREWRATLLHQGIAQTIVAKSYRLLRAVLTTAVEDDRLLVRTHIASEELIGRHLRSDRSLPSLRSFSWPTACPARSSAHSSSSPPCVPSAGVRSQACGDAMWRRMVAAFTSRHS